MKRFRVISITIVIATLIYTSFILFKHKANFLPYHSIRVFLLGDRTETYEYSRENFMDFSSKRDSKVFGLKWCFKPEARMLPEFKGIVYYPEAIVYDIDHDARPEVYIASYTKKVYCLDGITGKILWTYKLPFGITGGVTNQLIDIDGDNSKELIFGTHAPLPIRVYCIRLGKNVANRLIWYKNVHGDFIEGGLSSLVTPEGKIRIIYGTRSAPYINGSLGVIAGNGHFVNSPTYSVDICMAKPSIYTTKDGSIYAITGSHGWAQSFYGQKALKKKREKYANCIFAKDIENGKIIWATYLGWDTGYSVNPITDVNYDGKKELIVVATDNQGRNVILNPETGDIIGYLPYKYKAHFMDEKGKIYIIGTDGEVNLYCFLYGKNKNIYKIKGDFTSIRYFLDIDNDGLPEFLKEEFEKDKIKILFYDVMSGNLKYVLEWDIDIKELKNSIEHSYSQHVLADCDNDGYWELITLINGYVACFDTPFTVKKIYPKYNTMPFRNIDGTGYNFLNLKNREETI